MGVNERIIIVGGGLSGLTLAYLLSKEKINATILEASTRLGGRIQTEKGVLGTPLELGATWFSDMHPNLLALIRELGIEIFPQFSKGISLFQTKSFEPAQRFYIPEAEKPSYRIAGGTQVLIDRLALQLRANSILLNTKAIAVKEKADGVVLETSAAKKVEADTVIICIPPQLAGRQIVFSPKLPEDLETVLPTVQTWMGGSVKFSLEYDQPFWRKEGYSGMLYSHAGIVTEMYDHTNYEENKFAFTGFLHGGTSAYPADVRKEFVLRQLAELLGKQALTPVSYLDKVWADEFVLDGSQVTQRPHQNNGHPLLQQRYMNGRLFFASTETAAEFAGYMEGAIIAARAVAAAIVSGNPLA